MNSDRNFHYSRAQNSSAHGHNVDATSGGIRYAQLREESQHNHCAEGNKRAILAERLARLGDLTKELEETDWKYTDTSGKNDGPTPYAGNVEERHFSLGRRL
mmetsp:Transcript_22223/g.33874  ORF Transcript_22223/g.33874 Transcript_22223/m.33874 type:complete len:102 (-) Transcript_22223:532-837(-)